MTLALKAYCSPVPIEKVAGEILTRTPESTVRGRANSRADGGGDVNLSNRIIRGEAQ